MISFYSMSTMYNFTQSMKSKNLWEQRKQSGYYDRMAEVDPDKASFQQHIDEMNSRKSDPELEAIATKLQQGKKLTPDEKQKLSRSNPELYKKAQEIEAEQKRYEESLKRCKTKEDVQRTRVNQLNGALSTIKSVESNPNIPLEKKLEVAERENMKVNACSQSTTEFVRNGSYARLPTEAEVAEALEQEREKSEVEPGVEQPDDAPQETPEETPEAKPPQLPGAQEDAPKAETPPAETAPQPTKPAAPEVEADSKPLPLEAQKVLDTYRRGAATRPTADADREEQLLRRHKKI